MQDIGRPDAGATTKKLFVGGLKEFHNEENLKSYFSQFGSVLSVSIVVDKETNKKRGFGFIEFDDHDAVDKVVLRKNHSIAGANVDTKKAISKAELAAGGRGGRGGGGGGSWGGNDGWSRGGGGGDNWGGAYPLI